MTWHKPKMWDRENTPKEIQEALRSYIEEDGLEYTDNFRYAPEDDPVAVAEFYAIRDAHCCGRADYRAWDFTGRMWIVGCNYGH